MNIRKAIGTGLLVFAIQFALVSVIGNIFGPFLGSSVTMGYVWQAVMVLLLIGIVHCASKWYFTGNTVNITKGLYLGLTLVLTSLTINLLQALPALAIGQDVVTPILNYVTSIPFWLTVGITIVTTTLTAYHAQKKRACNLKGAMGACMPKDKCQDCKGDKCDKSHS